MPSDVIAVKDATPVASLNRPLPPEKVYVPACVVGDAIVGDREHFPTLTIEHRD